MCAETNLISLDITLEEEIDAPQEIVFYVLLNVPVIWWQLPSADSLLNLEQGSGAHVRRIVLEARPGGRLYENFDLFGTSQDGTLYATVTSVRDGEWILLEGSLGLSTAGVPFGSIAISAEPRNERTTVTLIHRASQTVPSQLESFMRMFWTDFLNRLDQIVAVTMRPLGTDVDLDGDAHSNSNDPLFQLEQAYQDLQNNLIQVRQATAQAIASEKMIEQQCAKNRDQAETWGNRAALARKQKKDDLALQAEGRQKHYIEAAVNLEEELKSQRAAVIQLRERLTQLEAQVQRAYTRKQVLFARSGAAEASKHAREILSSTSTDGIFAIIEKVEQEIVAREQE